MPVSIAPLLLLTSAAAYAGYWNLTLAATGMATTSKPKSQIPPLSTNATGTNSVAAKLGTGSDGYGGGTAINGVGSASASVTVTVNVTGSWVVDAGDTAPAPSSVMVVESANAQFSGSNGDGSLASNAAASDGIGDPGVAGTGPNNTKTFVSQSSGIHFTSYNGSISFSRTLSAGGSTSSSDMMTSCSASAVVESYSVSIHAQPYNWHIATATDTGQGTIHFTYAWNSTTGNIANITSCYWHEYVAFDGHPLGTTSNPITFNLSPDPPFDSTFSEDNPFVSPGTGRNGGVLNVAGVHDDQLIPPLDTRQSYGPGTITSHQTWQYDDTATGATNVTIPGPDSGPVTITNVVSFLDVNDYLYTVTKSGSSAKKTLPNN